MTIWERKTPSFGFISTRFAGLDGVSLETQKWVDVLAAKKCPVFYMAGNWTPILRFRTWCRWPISSIPI